MTGPARMHADEVTVATGTVRKLLAAQFPHWARFPLRRLPDTGTDSAIYRLGDELGIRLPRISWAVGQIEREYRWLERLAPGLPVPLPLPVAKGEPGEGYPFPWLVYRWVGGTSLDLEPGQVTADIGRQVAECVVALEQVPTGDGPHPGRRGLPLAGQDEAARWGIARLGQEIDAERALSVWNAALEAGPWGDEPVWVHGDLLPGNVLVDGGRLTGLIDWSQAGVGDPACDAMLAWSLPPGAREAFRCTLGFDAATWARARGWVVEQAVLYIPYYERTLPRAVAEAHRRLSAALWE